MLRRGIAYTILSASLFLITVAVAMQAKAEGFGASTTTTDLNDASGTYLQVENCWPRSIFGLIFGQSCPDPGEQAIKHAIAARIRSEGSVNTSRAAINTSISQNVASRLVTEEVRPDGSTSFRTEETRVDPESVRALADLAAANAHDRNKVSAYSGGGGNGRSYSYGRAEARIDLSRHFRK